MRVVTIISEKVGSLIENKEISQEEIKKDRYLIEIAIFLLN